MVDLLCIVAETFSLVAEAQPCPTDLPPPSPSHSNGSFFFTPIPALNSSPEFSSLYNITELLGRKWQTGTQTDTDIGYSLTISCI